MVFIKSDKWAAQCSTSALERGSGRRWWDGDGSRVELRSTGSNSVYGGFLCSNGWREVGKWGVRWHEETRRRSMLLSRLSFSVGRLLNASCRKTKAYFVVGTCLMKLFRNVRIRLKVTTAALIFDRHLLLLSWSFFDWILCQCCGHFVFSIITRLVLSAHFPSVIVSLSLSFSTLQFGISRHPVGFLPPLKYLGILSIRFIFSPPLHRLIFFRKKIPATTQLVWSLSCSPTCYF